MKKQPFECEALDGEGRNEKTKKKLKKIWPKARNKGAKTHVEQRHACHAKIVAIR